MSNCRRIAERSYLFVAFLLLAGISLAADAPAGGAIPRGLFDYVARPEPACRWELRKARALDGGTIFDLHLVSQEWQGIVWEHAVQVFQPAGVAPTATLLLWNQGGAPSASSEGYGLELSRRMQAPTAIVYGIPNQPLLGGMKEDQLVAETFVRYLETGNDAWPLLFPMVKSLVKGMDALQEFARREWRRPVERFVVGGASKRGWTTWLTAAADARVKAVVPVVIDTLNMQAQMPYQLRSFGAYSQSIADYTARGLVPMPDTAAARRLWSMVDPWVYRQRLSLPKLLINGANDPFWTTDALNLYWNDLSGPKWVLYVPNAGHGLEQKQVDGSTDRERLLNAIAAFGRHMLRENPMPEVSWVHDRVGRDVRLSVETRPAALAARLWVARAPTRDFREARWIEQPLEASGTRVVGTVEPPRDLRMALFAELDFEIGGLRHQVSTQMRIVEPGE